MATCPAFPGLSAFGETAEEALAEAQVALGLFMESYRERNIPLPEPDVAQAYSGQTRTRLPKSLHRRAAQLAALDNISLNQFIVNAVEAKVAGEDLGRRFFEKMEQLLANQSTLQRMAIASIVWDEQPMPRIRETVKTEIATEKTIYTAGLEFKKGN